MNSITKAFLIIGSVLMVCLTALGIALVVSGGDEPAPAPTVTAPAPEPSTPAPTTDPDDLVFEILEEVWNKQSYSDQQSLCVLFNTYPDQAWQAFDSPQNKYITQDQFVEFFSGKCSTI